MEKYSIYLIENLINHKCYIGMTSKKIDTRFKQHVRKSKNTKGFAIHHAIRKYGKDNFDIVTLDVAPDYGSACELEKLWISKFDTFKDIGYNELEGGNAGGAEEGHPLYNMNPEDSPMYGKTGEDHPAYGRSHSKEARKSISRSQKGKGNSFYGRKHSDETKEKMKESSREGIKLSKKEMGEIKWLIFNSDMRQVDIANEYGITRSYVSQIKRRECLNYIDPKKPSRYEQ